MEGVVASPLAKYADHNVRLCRPHRPAAEAPRAHPRRRHRRDRLALRPAQRRSTSRCIWAARPLLPPRHRKRALRFGSGAARSVICTSLLGQLFADVGFPVLPQVTYPDAPGGSERRAARAALASGRGATASARAATRAPPDAADAARLRSLAVLPGGEGRRAGRARLRARRAGRRGRCEEVRAARRGAVEPERRTQRPPSRPVGRIAPPYSSHAVRPCGLRAEGCSRAAEKPQARAAPRRRARVFGS